LTALLALFDLDGTLFLTHDPLSGRALVATLEQVYDVEVPAGAPANVEHRGLTAKRIGRNVLRAAGVADAAVDERLDTWCAAFAERYLELLATADTSGWAPRPGAAEGLARLQAAGVRLGLVTGNPQPMARTRLERLGLARFFPPGEGAVRLRGRRAKRAARARPEAGRRLAGFRNGRDRRHARGRLDREGRRLPLDRGHLTSHPRLRRARGRGRDR
jgi:phosphoglycolate phosphatase-like HAD superfamily hydrolase